MRVRVGVRVRVRARVRARVRVRVRVRVGVRLLTVGRVEREREAHAGDRGGVES